MTASACVRRWDDEEKKKIKTRDGKKRKKWWEIRQSWESWGVEKVKRNYYQVKVQVLCQNLTEQKVEEAKTLLGQKSKRIYM